MAIYNLEYIQESFADKYKEYNKNMSISQSTKYVKEAKYKVKSEVENFIKLIKTWLQKYNNLYTIDEKKEVQSNLHKIEDIYNERFGNIKTDNLTEDDCDNIEKELISIVNKYNNDSNIKNQVIESLKKHDYDGNIIFKKFVCNEFEKYDNEISYLICDQDQNYCISVLNIIDQIAKELISTIGNKFKASTGDGDEGCIYIKKYK